MRRGLRTFTAVVLAELGVASNELANKREGARGEGMGNGRDVMKENGDW